MRREWLRQKLRTPHADRLWYVAEALRRGMAVETVAQLTQIDPWFLANIQQIVAYEAAMQARRRTTPQEASPLPVEMLTRPNSTAFQMPALPRYWSTAERGGASV